MLEKLLPAERTALLAFAILILLSCLGAVIYRWLWIAGLGLVGFLWLVAIALGISRLIRALGDQSAPIPVRLRSAMAMPVALGALLALNWGFSVGPRIGASVYLALNADKMRAAQQIAGKGRAAAIPYVEGIPDGGAAIIRSAGNPRSFPPTEGYRLTGGAIRNCDRIVSDAWLCDFG